MNTASGRSLVVLTSESNRPEFKLGTSRIPTPLFQGLEVVIYALKGANYLYRFNCIAASTFADTVPPVC